jgi:hypothetical protein
MEDAGRIRRGYFVDGLGAAQFAVSGALDRLRAVREGSDPPAEGEVVLLAAEDPANPYGAALPWPRRGDGDRRPYQRAAGAYVVLVDGIAALYIDRGGASIGVLPAADDPDVAVAAARSLRTLVFDGRVRELVIRKVDGEDVATSPFRSTLLEAGFVAGIAGCSAAIARRPGRSQLGALTPSPPVPEGDTLFERRPACARIWWADRHGARSGSGRGPATPPDRRQQIGAGIARQEPADPLDNGLELRTHLRMNGTWHRYRPGERWRRPPGRARLVLEVPGAVAVCFDAPVVELFETRVEAVHPSLSRLGPDLLAPGFDSGEALRRLRSPERVAVEIGEAMLTSAMAGVGNIWKNETLWEERVSPFDQVGDLTTRP